MSVWVLLDGSGSGERQHTRISNLNFDHSAIEGLSIKSQGFLEGFNINKLNVSESLGALHLAVLDETNADNLAAFEEIGDALIGCVIGQVAKVGSVRGLVGKRLREVLTD